MEIGDIVYYKAREYRVVLVRGPFIFLKDIKNSTRRAKWINADAVQFLRHEPPPQQ